MRRLKGWWDILGLIVGLGLGGISSICVHGQSFNLTFQHLTPLEDGLESQYHIFIKKDSRGFTWISSSSGVLRFDGLTLEKFLPGLNIQGDFFEDDKGDIWFSSVEGIHIYNYSKDTFKIFQLKNEADSILQNGARLIFIEHGSILWFVASGTIYSYNLNNSFLKPFAETDGIRFTVDTHSNGDLKSIVACLWLRGPGIEYFTLNKDKGFEKFILLVENREAGSLIIKHAIFQREDLLWLFTNQGLVSYNPKKPLTYEKHPLPFNSVREITDGVLTLDRYLWISSRNAGLLLFDTKTRKCLDRFLYSEEDNNSISHNTPLEISFDSEEFLWVSNSDHSAIDFAWVDRNTFSNPFDSLDLKNPKVLSILEGVDGTVWCGTNQKVIQGFSPSGQPSITLDIIPFSQQFSNIPLYELKIDTLSNLWALSDTVIMTRENAEWKSKYQISEGVFYGFSSIKSNLKLIATSEGVFEFMNNPTFESSLSLRKELFYEEKSIKTYRLLHKENRIYGPSLGTDLFTFEYTDDSLVNIDKFDVDSDVFAILEGTDSDQILLGTSNGIKRLDLKSRECKTILDTFGVDTEKPIYNLFRDYKGRVWFTSNSTLFVYDPKVEEIHYFTQKDGLPQGQFLQFSSLQASDGKTWLGTHYGVVAFYPDSIKPYPFGPKVFFKSFITKNKPYEMDTSIQEVLNLNLRYNQNTLEFETVALGSYLPNESKLAFRLLNYKDEWKRVENGSTLEFNQVPPGNYTLEVYGINANGVKGDIKRLPITIAPPFWQTTWFYLICLGAAGALVSFIVRYYVDTNLRKQRESYAQQKKIEKVLEDERDRIAAEMHDDLGSGLNSIRFMIEQIEKPVLDPKVSEQLDRIESHTTNSIEHMQEIIWAMNGSYDKLSELVSYTRRYILEYFEDYNIDCRSNLLEDLPETIISGEKRKNIFLCVKEGAHNIVKHAQASQVKLYFSLDTAFTIELSDNGKGIDLSNIRKGGNGLRNMKNRMEKIGGKMDILVNKGTLLRFSIPLDKLQQSAMIIP